MKAQKYLSYSPSTYTNEVTKGVIEGCSYQAGKKKRIRKEKGYGRVTCAFPFILCEKEGRKAITEHRGRYDEEEGLSRVRSGYKTFQKERNDQEMEKKIGKASLKYNIDWKDEQLVSPKGSSDNIC